MRGDLTYSVPAGEHGRQSDIIPVDFQLSDISRLTPGEVFYQPEGADVVVSTADFLRRARAAC